MKGTQDDVCVGCQDKGLVLQADLTDTDGVIPWAREKVLFKRNEISIDEGKACEAFTFVTKIKRRFQNDEQVFKTFLDTLYLYRQEKKHINQVFREVAALFENHSDLLEEFTGFLPNTSVTTSTQHPPSGQNSDQHFNERSSIAASKFPIQLDKQHRRDKIITSHERDLSVEISIDEDEAPPKKEVSFEEAISFDSPIKRLITVDALSYLKEVRDMFQDKQEKYDMFLDVMKDFKAQRIDTDGFRARVKELLKGHNNLILGFNTFLPKGYEISIDEDEATPAPPRTGVTFEEAISFVNKIEKRFQNDERVYKTFLDTLNLYRQEKKHINQVYREVAALFESHPDLLEEFTRFLQNTSVTTSTQHPPGGQNSDQHLNERSSMSTSKFPIVKQYRRPEKIIASHKRDFNVDCTVVDGKRIIKVHKEQRKRAQKDDPHDLDYNRDLNYQHVPAKRMCAKKAEGGLTDEFPSYDDKHKLKGKNNQTSRFCEKVKEKLGNSGNYRTFLRCLEHFKNGYIQRDGLHDLILRVLGNYPDLLKELNPFLEQCYKIDGFPACAINKNSVCSGGQLFRSSKLEDKEKYQKREVDGSKKRERHRNKYKEKPIQELDLKNCESCTPSYRLLPEDYPIPKASKRSELDAQVLNDHCVLVTPGSSFKPPLKNRYEKRLFKCEDDRFQYEWEIESVKSAAKCAEELYNSIIEKKINIEGPLRIEEHFSVLNLRCIKRLYDDDRKQLHLILHWKEVLEALRTNPTQALPMILAHLKQKQEELTRARSDSNKAWAEIYAKNHNKSLDHRRFQATSSK